MAPRTSSVARQQPGHARWPALAAWTAPPLALLLLVLALLAPVLFPAAAFPALRGPALLPHLADAASAGLGARPLSAGSRVLSGGRRLQSVEVETEEEGVPGLELEAEEVAEAEEAEEAEEAMIKQAGRRTTDSEGVELPSWMTDRTSYIIFVVLPVLGLLLQFIPMPRWVYVVMGAGYLGLGLYEMYQAWLRHNKHKAMGVE